MNATKMIYKQTAVEWLIDNWIKFNDIDIELDDFANLRPLLKQAKQMEWQQMENVWDDSRIEDFGDEYIGKQTSFNDYYNQTFKQQTP